MSRTTSEQCSIASSRQPRGCSGRTPSPLLLERTGCVRGGARTALGAPLAGRPASPIRALVLVRLAELEERLGHMEAAEAADREVEALVEPGMYPHWLAVVGLAFHTMRRGDTEEAVRLGRQALEEAERLDDWSRVNAIGNLASILIGARPNRGGTVGSRASHSRGPAERTDGLRELHPGRPRPAQPARA